MNGMRPFTIVSPLEEHLDYIAAHARPEDAAEIAALADCSMREAIGPLSAGQKFVALGESSVPFAVFGIREAQEPAPFLFMNGSLAANCNGASAGGARPAFATDGPETGEGYDSRPAPGSTALIWMIGTRELTTYRREMLVYGRMIINDWLRRFFCLCNIVHAENLPAIRMLRKWGCSIMPAAPFGPRNHLFHPFFILAA